MPLVQQVIRATAGALKLLKAGDALRFPGATSGYVALKAGATPGSLDFTLPGADGTSGQALVTNASGVLSFAAFDMLSTLSTSANAISGAASAVISRLNVITLTSAGATITLPAVSGNGGKFLGLVVHVSSTKLATIDGNASETIDGSLTRIMWAGESALLYCDGTTWTKVAGLSIPMFCVMRITANQTGVVTATPTVVQLSSTVADNTGLMADTGNNRMNVQRPGTATISGEVTWDGASPASARVRSEVFLTGTQIKGGESNHVANSYNNPTAIKVGQPVVAGDTIQLKGYHEGGSNGTFYGSTGDSCFLQFVETPVW